MNFNSELVGAVVTICIALIGVASLSVLLSKNSNTVGVIQAGGGAFSGGLATALSPITGTAAGAAVYGSSSNNSIGFGNLNGFSSMG